MIGSLFRDLQRIGADVLAIHSAQAELRIRGIPRDGFQRGDRRCSAFVDHLEAEQHRRIAAQRQLGRLVRERGLGRRVQRAGGNVAVVDHATACENGRAGGRHDDAGDPELGTVGARLAGHEHHGGRAGGSGKGCNFLHWYFLKNFKKGSTKDSLKPTHGLETMRLTAPQRAQSNRRCVGFRVARALRLLQRVPLKVRTKSV
ncbi:hypothetical protein D9M72_488160 [compost metagenome]